MQLLWLWLLALEVVVVQSLVLAVQMLLRRDWHCPERGGEFEKKVVMVKLPLLP